MSPRGSGPLDQTLWVRPWILRSTRSIVILGAVLTQFGQFERNDRDHRACALEMRSLRHGVNWTRTLGGGALRFHSTLGSAPIAATTIENGCVRLARQIQRGTFTPVAENRTVRVATARDAFDTKIEYAQSSLMGNNLITVTFRLWILFFSCFLSVPKLNLYFTQSVTFFCLGFAFLRAQREGLLTVGHALCLCAHVDGNCVPFLTNGHLGRGVFDCAANNPKFAVGVRAIEQIL